MHWRSRTLALCVSGAATVAACASESTGAGGASFLRAAIAGSVQAEYAGSGSFAVLPEGTPGWRFVLHSQGAGEWAGHGLAFQSLRAPAPGEHPIGILEEDGTRATYWYDEGSARKIFSARSGTLSVAESTPKRVAGTFRLTASLLYDCTLEAGFPGKFLRCAPAAEEAEVEITGSFRAGPLGADSPGLIPYEP